MNWKQDRDDMLLGRLVRRMPERAHATLTYSQNENGSYGWFFRSLDEDTRRWVGSGPYDTVEAALKAALGETE